MLFIAATLASEGSAHACAGCSNPNLPTARSANVVLAPGEVTAAFNLTITTMRVVHSELCPDIGPICRTRNEPGQLHDQRFWVGELRPIFAVGITPTFGMELQLPLRLVNSTIDFRRLDGTIFTPDYENIHHRDETLFGISDPWLLGRASGALGSFRVTTRAGLGLPLGQTQEDPFARGRAGLPHQHIQFGTGTFYPVFAIDAAAPIARDRVRVGGYAQGLVFPSANGHGYQPGNRYAGGLWGDVEIVPKLRVGAAMDLLNEQPERWGGLVQQDGNVGRTDLLAGGSVSYAFGSMTASISVKTPVYQNFIEPGHRHDRDPGQLTYPAIVNFAFQTSFGGPTAKPAGKH